MLTTGRSYLKTRAVNNTIGFNKLFKKFYRYESIVKINNCSHDINNTENSAKSLEFNLYDADYSIFIKPEEKLAEIIKKLEGTDEKVQKVEVYELNDKNNKVSLDKTFSEIYETPLRFEINGHINQKYLPSSATLFTKMYYHYLPQTTHNQKDLKQKIDNLLLTYQELQKEYETAEKLIERNLIKRQKLYLNLGILFFVAHLILFYVLIYQLYGWDTIEPITYIVGNVYWIAALMFLLKYRTKLDMNYFISPLFTGSFKKQRANLLGYSRMDKQFIKNEIDILEGLKNNIQKI